MLIGREIIGTVAYMGGIMSLPIPFIDSWQRMVEYNSEYLVQQKERISYTFATVSYHSFARNSLVDQMKGDWLLQLDTDITFDPDIVGRMLLKMDRHNIDVLIAPYVYKSHPHPPVVYGWNPKKKEKFILGDWDDKADVIPVRSSGAGCLLVRKKVFDKIKSKLGESPFDIYFDKKTPLSEDHSFFERCWKLRIPVYFSPSITVGHLVYNSLTLNKDYDKTKMNIDKNKIMVKGMQFK